MSTDDEKPSSAEVHFEISEEWQKKLEAGLSLGPYHLDVPMQVDILPTGAIRIACPCIRILGSVHPMTLLLEFSPLAAQNLKLGLDALQMLQGGLVPKVEEPSKQ